MADEALASAVSAEGMLTVRVTSRASADRLAVEQGLVRVWVTAPADRGKANEAAIALVARALGVPKSAIALVRGATARTKLLKVRR